MATDEQYLALINKKIGDLIVDKVKELGEELTKLHINFGKGEIDPSLLGSFVISNMAQLFVAVDMLSNDDLGKRLAKEAMDELGEF